MRTSSVSFIIIILISIGCSSEKSENAVLRPGTWRAVLELQGTELPFNFEVTIDSSHDYDVYLRNAEERLLLDEVSISGDSVNIALHVFDANIKAKILGDSLRGVFIKNYEKDYLVPFRAASGHYFRFKQSGKDSDIPDFSGKYEVVFTNEADTTLAVGIFDQAGDTVTGTFLTPTGDYRYLQGSVIDDKLHLSTFDGNHAYLFTAKKAEDGKLIGEYLSGKTWKQSWIAIKNENATLPDAESLTFLKPGFETLAFSFPDVNGKNISLTDEKYKNKVVIIQLFGTWCPNCMDETRFLTQWYKENRNRGVEVIGLAYERKNDFAYASERLKKMIDKFGVTYDFAIAPATNDKAEAAKTLPMLNTVVAFPTTIFIGKDGKVKTIHTGFSGPGTGIYYQHFIEHFNETVNELLSGNSDSSKI
jgi:thiol-disulfide isomerase/thioredoxin